MTLIERDDDLSVLRSHARRAVAGEGNMVIVTGEAGAGKSSIIDEFARSCEPEMRVLWGACDPLSTPRPLGPLHDVADELGSRTRDALAHAAHAYEIFDAVTADLSGQPTLFVIDDVHWADQGTADLLRHLLRRIRHRATMVVLSARVEELTDAIRLLLGDIARTSGSTSIAVQPLSLDAVGQLVGDLPLDAAALHQLTAGNAFFVTQMIEHRGHDLPATVRDAVLARTVGLDAPAWDVMNLLACAPGPLADDVLAPLGIDSVALHQLSEVHLIARSTRGITFRHDLCRLAVREVIPPGAEPQLHRRLLAAYDDVGGTDPVVIAHHAAGAADDERLRAAAADAARASARSGAHRQSAEFYRMALAASPDPLEVVDPTSAQLLESLAAECYLIDRLDEAVAAGERALAVRAALADVEGMRSVRHALAVYEWYNANRGAADEQVAAAIASASGDVRAADSPALGHAFAMDAFLAMQSGDVLRARDSLARAGDIATRTGAPELAARVQIITGVCDVLDGVPSGRAEVLDILARGPAHLDEIYSSGYSNLTYLDVEQRRLGPAGDLLAQSIEMTVERDLPVCQVWQLGSRGRLGLIGGDWDGALSDSTSVLGGPSAPLAQIWPLLVRGLISVRSTGVSSADLDDAWELACRYGEPLRLLPAASALVEQHWVTGLPEPRIADAQRLLRECDVAGVEWARGDLAVWLRRVGAEADVDVDAVAPPYRLWLTGEVHAAADMFARLGVTYDLALATVESGGRTEIANGLAALDALGAAAVADRLRRDLRLDGVSAVPSRRRRSTLANAAGLTSRQQEVLGLLAMGLTNTELADRLFLSAKTVDHHVSAILTRLEVPNRRAAVRRGRELGVIE